MSINFRELIFENQNNISVKLTLQAPVGTSIIETEVGAKATVTLHPNVNDIRAVEIKVVAGGHEHTDIETFELRGSPFPMFFETLQVRTSIGSIHGQASVRF